MKKYTDQIKPLIDEVENNEVAQITIDFFQDFEEEFLTDREKPIERDQLGAQNYHIGNILEVIDSKFEVDIRLLKAMYKILEEWAEDIDFRNRALGIPVHKG